MIVFLSGAMLTGCVQEKTIRVPVEVKVPVPVKVAPPPSLVDCGREKPDFLFYKPNDPRYSAALKPQDTPKLRAWVDARQNCLDAWRAFYE